MELQERMEKMLKASPEALEMIDAILDGRNIPQAREHTRLVTIAEARAFLGWSYSRMRRAMADGLVDIVTATGRRLVKEESLYELASGCRQPSAEALARREARNAARREEYRRRKALSTGAAEGR
jgi:hypothetical protein